MWNSFGLAFDPITKILWDTQIGLPFGDEINLVDPGFNGGYNKIDGIWLRGYNIKPRSNMLPLFTQMIWSILVAKENIIDPSLRGLKKWFRLELHSLILTR